MKHLKTYNESTSSNDFNMVAFIVNPDTALIHIFFIKDETASGMGSVRLNSIHPIREYMNIIIDFFTIWNDPVCDSCTVDWISNNTIVGEKVRAIVSNRLNLPNDKLLKNVVIYGKELDAPDVFDLDKLKKFFNDGTESMIDINGIKLVDYVHEYYDE